MTGNESKKCIHCDKPAKQHYTTKGRHPNGYNRTCGSKECLYKRYTLRDRDFWKAIQPRGEKRKCEHCGKEYIISGRSQKWCKECVPDLKARSIMCKYKLSAGERLDLLNMSNHLCPICLKGEGKVVDHNHKNGKVRGIICNRCNMALSLIENKEAVTRAIRYVETDGRTVDP